MLYRRWATAPFLTTFFLFVAAATIFIQPSQANAQSSPDETSAYERSVNDPTIENLREYLREFPFGVHREEVKKRLDQQVEGVAWERAKSQKTRADLTAYLNLYPAGAHAQEAKRLIAALDSEAGMHDYPDTALNGIVSTTTTAMPSDCRTLCTGKSDCAGYSVTSDNTCRLFSSISSARGSGTSMAATRQPLTGYSAPDGKPKTTAPQQQDEAADRQDREGPAPVAECDRLAAASFDSQNPTGVTGVRFENINAAMAITACHAAVEDYSKEPRFRYQLGRAYDKDGNHEQALKFYRQAVDMNYNAASVGLGYAYQYGVGVKQDYRKAFEIYTSALKRGGCDVCENLAILYEEGDGVQQDYRKAAELYTNAIKYNAHSIASYTNLAYMYYEGRGVTRDDAKAFQLLKAGAANGSSGSIYYGLAIMYDAGRGVAYDGDQAAYWYEKALRDGFAFARDQLREQPGMGTLTFRRALQSRLQRAGVYDGPIDGSFGPMSQTAVDRIFGRY
jgi:TPR repeat protein